MHVIDVGRVAQIVAEQQIIRLHIQRIAEPDAPAILMIFGQVIYVGRVGKRGVAHPDPDHPHVFMDRVRADPAVRRWRVLRGRIDTDAVTIECQTVIAALQFIALHAALRQRQEPVGADVFRRADLAVFAAPQDDILTQDRFGLRFGRQVMRPTCDIPGVTDKGHCTAPYIFRTIICSCTYNYADRRRNLSSEPGSSKQGRHLRHRARCQQQAGLVDQ